MRIPDKDLAELDAVIARGGSPRPLHGPAREHVVNCDNLFTIPKRSLGLRRGSLGPDELDRLNQALRIALGLI